MKQQEIGRRARQPDFRHRGVAMIYVVVSMVAFLGFCSLAVDLGRVERARTELQRVADSAARAGAAFIPQGSSAVQTAAINISNDQHLNKVDGQTYSISASNVTIGYFNPSTHAFTSTYGASYYQAVQVGQLTYNVPLVFGSILGMSKCQVTATSVAALVSEPSSTTQYITAHGNPWLAGAQSGTKGSVPDPGYYGSQGTPDSNTTHPWMYDTANPSAVATAEKDYRSDGDSDYSLPTDSSKVESTDYQNDQPYGSPSEFLLTVTPGSIVTVSIPDNSSNEANNQGYLVGGTGNTYADGTSGGSVAYYEDDAANTATGTYSGFTNPGNVNAIFSSSNNPATSSSAATEEEDGISGMGSNYTEGIDANSDGVSNSEHGISNIVTPINSVVGVFMDQNGATYGGDSSQEENESNSPVNSSGQFEGSGLDFSQSNATNYTQLEPGLNQSFYVGDGQNSSNVQQMIVVPNNAYALFLGTMDGHEWSNNVGGFNATVTQYQIQIVH